MQRVELHYEGKRVTIEDSTILGYSRTQDGLEVHVETWNERVVVVLLSSVVALQDVSARDLSWIRKTTVVRPSDEFVRSSVDAYYTDGIGELQLFEFVAPDDRIGLRVVTGLDGHLRVLRFGDS